MMTRDKATWETVLIKSGMVGIFIEGRLKEIGKEGLVEKLLDERRPNVDLTRQQLTISSLRSNRCVVGWNAQNGHARLINRGRNPTASQLEDKHHEAGRWRTGVIGFYAFDPGLMLSGSESGNGREAAIRRTEPQDKATKVKTIQQHQQQQK